MSWEADAIATALDGSGERITVEWEEIVGGTVALDTQAITGGTRTARTLELAAFVHTPNYSDARVQKYGGFTREVRMIDYAPGALAAVLQPAAGVTIGRLRFLIAGDWFVQARLDDRPCPAMDARHAGETTLETLILERAR